MKRSPHLQPFAHDHYQGLHVFRRLRTAVQRGADSNDIASYVGSVWDDHLSEHFEQEEDLLLEPLRRIGANEMAEQLLAEHRSLRDLAAELRQEATDEEKVEAFGKTLRDHIRFEDRELFVHLENNLPEDELAVVGRRLAEIHGGTDEMWPTPPWEDG